jgi:hypothetical protein
MVSSVITVWQAEGLGVSIEGSAEETTPEELDGPWIAPAGPF